MFRMHHLLGLRLHVCYMCVTRVLHVCYMYVALPKVVPWVTSALLPFNFFLVCLHLGFPCCLHIHTLFLFTFFLLINLPSAFLML